MPCSVCVTGRHIAGLAAVGDTCFVLDAVRRLTRISPGERVLTEAIHVPSVGTLPFNPRALLGGNVLHAQYGPPDNPALESRGQLTVRARPDGAILDTVTTLDVRGQLLRIRLGGERELQMVQPFVELDRLAIAGRGGWMAIVRRPSLMYRRLRQTEKPSFLATARCDLSRVRNVRSRSGE